MERSRERLDRHNVKRVVQAQFVGRAVRHMNVDALDVVIADSGLSGETYIRAGGATLPIVKLAHARELDAWRSERARPACGGVLSKLDTRPRFSARNRRRVDSLKVETKNLRGVSDSHRQAVTRAPGYEVSGIEKLMPSVDGSTRLSLRKARSGLFSVC